MRAIAPRAIYGTIAVLTGIVMLRARERVWEPCSTTDGFDSPACIDAQSHADTALIHGGWILALVGGLVLLAIAATTRQSRRPAVAIIVVVVAGNVLFDYAATPAINGGYISHDDHPGMYLVMSIAVIAAGLVALASVVLDRARRGSQPASARGPLVRSGLQDPGALDAHCVRGEDAAARSAPPEDSTRGTLALPLISLVLAAVGACALAASALAVLAPEGVAEVLWIAGAVAVAWAAIAAVVAAVALWRARRDGSAFLPGMLIVLASVAILVIAGWMHAPFGSGGGAA